MGTPRGTSDLKLIKLEYSGLNLSPHCDMQWASSVTISSQRVFSLTIVFFYEYACGRSALNGRVTCSPDSLISYPRSLYHVPPARVLIRSHSRFMCFLTVTGYGLSTHRRILVCFPFLLLSRRLVCLCFSLMPFSFHLIDLSLCLPLLLMPFRL